MAREYYSPSVQLRNYNPSDAAATREVFFRAVHETASHDYTAEQCAAWAPREADLYAWNEKLLGNRTIVAVQDDRVIGFSDARPNGYIDMMFISPDAVRRGVASALLQRVTDRAGAEGVRELTALASITARPFFERHGFVCDQERHPVMHGVRMTNFSMSKVLYRSSRENAPGPRTHIR